MTVEIPAEWVEAGAKELVLQQTNGLCELGKVCQECDCFAVVDDPPGLHKDGYAREHARAVLAAAYPLIHETIMTEERAVWAEQIRIYGWPTNWPQVDEKDIRSCRDRGHPDCQDGFDW